MTPNIRLVIIEDNPAIVENMTDFLESKGYVLDFAMIEIVHSKYIDMYEGAEKIPGHFKELVKLLPPGVHTVDDPKKKHPINVGVIQLPDKEIPYFMFFHGREFFEENSWLHPRQILMISLALLLIPGIIIG